ncbi:MAG: hypothetical protein IJA69_02925, partial [Clostridia bacterium]|nr:hypothetical protein [Clostridia bacterium]
MKKIKLAFCLISFFLCMAFVAVGAFALNEVNLNIQGSINFEFKDVMATVSQATVSGGTATCESAQSQTLAAAAYASSNIPMQAFTIDKDNKRQDVLSSSQYASWSNLTLAFDEFNDKIEIDFKISNISPNQNDYMLVELNSTVDSAIASVDLRATTMY